MNKYHYDTCGLDNVYLVNGYEVREYDGKPAVGIHNLDGLHKVIGCSLVEMSTVLSGKEFRFLRHEMDLSQKAVGHLFGKEDQTVAKWEKDELPVPQMADVLIRAMFVEWVGGESEVNALLKLLSDVDREIHHIEFLMEESQKGWRVKDNEPLAA